MKTPDKARDRYCSFFSSKLKLAEWTNRTIDKLPIIAIGAIGREAPQRIEDVISCPRLLVMHRMRHDFACPGKQTHCFEAKQGERRIRRHNRRIEDVLVHPREFQRPCPILHLSH